MSEPLNAARTTNEVSVSRGKFSACSAIEARSAPYTIAQQSPHRLELNPYTKEKGYTYDQRNCPKRLQPRIPHIQHLLIRALVQQYLQRLQLRHIEQQPHPPHKRRAEACPRICIVPPAAQRLKAMDQVARDEQYASAQARWGAERAEQFAELHFKLDSSDRRWDVGGISKKGFGDWPGFARLAVW